MYDPITKVIGIATEVLNPAGRSFDVIKYESANWTESDRAKANRTQRDTRIFLSNQMFKASFVEYPSDAEESFKTAPLKDDPTSPQTE